MGFFRSLTDPEFGLVQANLRAYFTSRASGQSHRSALETMLRTRYRVEGTKRQQLAAELDTALKQDGASRDWQLRSVIVEMYKAEVPEKHQRFARLGEVLDECIADWESRDTHGYLRNPNV